MKALRSSPIRSQSGQLIVEAILIMVALFAVTLIVANYFKKQDFFQSLIQGPWQSLSGMLENGGWGTPQATMQNHPNGHFRHIVIVGEFAQ